MRLYLDYETRSRCDLKTAGAIKYAKDESTSILCLAYKVGELPTMLWIPERARMPEALDRAFRTATLIGHNASFERAITRHTLTRYNTLTKMQKDMLLSLTPDRWRCTAAKAAASSLPRKLELAAQVLGLSTQKDKEGHRLMLKYSKPRKPSKNNPKEWWDDKHELRAIYRYCTTDVEAEYLLDEALPDLSDYEQKIWELDQKINDRGVLIDIPTVRRILKLMDEEQKNVTETVRHLSGNRISEATQTAKVLAFVNARGANMQNLQAATIREKLLEDDVSPIVREMLECRQTASKTSTAKYMAMIKAVGEDDRARELLLYNGAIPTARWAGRRLQPQNFQRPHLKYQDIEKIIKRIGEDNG